MYVLVGAHGSWTIRELGFRTSPQRLAVGSMPAAQIDTAFGELLGFWGAVFTSKDCRNKNKTQESHPFYVCSFPCLRAYVNSVTRTQMGWDASTGMGLSAQACDSCHLLPPGLFIFRFTSGCSGRDPASVTFSNQIHTAVGLETASKPVCPVKCFSRHLRAVPLLSCSASPRMCPLSGVK